MNEQERHDMQVRLNRIEDIKVEQGRLEGEKQAALEEVVSMVVEQGWMDCLEIKMTRLRRKAGVRG